MDRGGALKKLLQPRRLYSKYTMISPAAIATIFIEMLWIETWDTGTKRIRPGRFLQTPGYEPVLNFPFPAPHRPILCSYNGKIRLVNNSPRTDDALTETEPIETKPAVLMP